ncbi:transcriptional regulator NrdR [Fructilactobacillus lindneri]|uniref:Transcriptional repressor NrdR n=2 Tax=Fructilactobacillus lindneri TaxID=53444 RepID=A0A0R2JVQ5_9LACO|nr:transcriptional regulator NrdR [Fructilactobacillus lindneri]ANZ58273.1 transcriptional regulator NrdR [Fructilactobacillus lindneri]ANZ59595.1 transcriptional regulator NrdR [Fructilactobacillus lindneri]KRN79100.1 transcriptional repressor nrdR [Fructilactobacillus lindneri DSM 20690 = JCM 11027]POG98621.1 transcriptional regulator NrdR [Fructilactobacillus lindneri]POH04009.1 transcriptional regulator NrdR [Fructilactobacillus lindneri]
MKCPKCFHTSSKVIESRPIEGGKSIRRRRECEDCGHRFTTFETIEDTPMLVVKKDGAREEFSSEKILRGIIRSCEKRPVSMEQMNEIVSETEKNVENQDTGSHEVSSEAIGKYVMAGLKKVDEIAYIRFASVYRQFKDMNEFYSKMKELMGDSAESSEE